MMKKKDKRVEMKGNEFLNYCKKLQACVKEYKKQIHETADDEDAAYFYDKGLKKWIKDNMESLDVLATLNLDRGFVTFVKHYLFSEEN